MGTIPPPLQKCWEKKKQLAWHMHTGSAHAMGVSCQCPELDEAFLCLELTQPVSEPRSCDGFKSIILSEACQGWLSFLRWPARLRATPACVIPVPQGSRLPAVGGQGAAGPSASIPSPWVAGFDRFSLAHALSAPFWGLWHGGGAFPAWFGVHAKWRRGTKFGGAGTHPSCWGPSHSVPRTELRRRRPSTRNTPGVVC